MTKLKVKISLLVFIANLIILLLFARNINTYPVAHDEYSYLLLADTFLEGRVCNPVMPHSEHFENFNVLIDKCYTSRYLPLQGLILAAGKLLGNPIVGNLIIKSLASAVAFWALLSLFNIQYALLGSILFSLNFQIISTWDLSFWGSSRNALAGFLILGALFRIINKKNCIRNALICGFGMGLLIISRPYEGLIFCLPILSYIAYQKSIFKSKNTTFYFCLLLFPMIFFIALLVYNKNVTGNYLLSPYQVYAEKYSSQPFIFGTPNLDVDYSNQEMANYYIKRENGMLQSLQSFSLNTVFSMSVKLGKYVNFLLPMYSYFLLLFLFKLKEKPEQKFLILHFMFYLLVISITIVPYASWYVSILSASIIFIVLYCIEALYKLKILNSLIKLLLTCFLLLYLVGGGVLAQKRLKSKKDFLHDDLQTLLEPLKKSNDNYLFLIKYNKSHNFLNEFVYNGANLTKQKFLFTRHLNSEISNQKLIEFYNDRKAFLIEELNNSLILKEIK